MTLIQGTFSVLSDLDPCHLQKVPSFSSPEHELLQVSYCDCAVSVVDFLHVHASEATFSV